MSRGVIVATIVTVTPAGSMKYERAQGNTVEAKQGRNSGKDLSTQSLHRSIGGMHACTCIRGPHFVGDFPHFCFLSPEINEPTD